MIIRALFILLACACAFARTPEGQLGALRLPNNARPVMLHAGDSFAVEALRRGELDMANGVLRFTLAPEWKVAPDGVAHAIATVPPEAAPGAYTLEWSEGDEGDQNVRAVYVLPPLEQAKSFSQQYTVACVSVDLNDSDSKAGLDAIAAADPAQVQFVAVFLRGDEGRFAGALTAIDASPLPTVVIVDSTEPVAQRWFGPRTFMTRYGPDAFLAPSAGLDGLGDELGTAPETIAKLRRDCKDARWTVGLFNSADEAVAMRNEITLNVDNALHVRLYGAAATVTDQQVRAWAGWFDAPRDYTLPVNRVVIFAANRKNFAPAKPAPKTP